MKLLKNPWTWIILLLFLIVLTIPFIKFQLWNYLPVNNHATSSNGYTCTKEHIYLPLRLQFKGCRTVTGTVERIKHEPDGDYHARLRVDWQYQLLLASRNYTQQSGDLVIEDVCFYTPAERFAKEACGDYRSPFPAPIVGKRYEITGNYAADWLHEGWTEIHGISEIKPLN